MSAARRRWPTAVAAVCAAVTVAGCGEVRNTITPAPYTANQLSVALDSSPNATHVGIYYAQARGYFRQTDLDVHLSVPTATAPPLEQLAAGDVEVALASEPEVLLARNRDEALVAVAAIVQGRLSAIKLPTPSTSGGRPIGPSSATGTRGGRARTTPQKPARHSSTSRAGTRTSRTRTSTTPAGTTTTVATSTTTTPATTSPFDRAGVPTYDGLVIVVRKATIVDHAPLIRRFVQALARGYEAARANPAAATSALVRLNPGLGYRRQLARVRASLGAFFPSGGHPWGWLSTSRWNAFSEWMTREHLLSNPNAPVDASTNELLAGQGV